MERFFADYLDELKMLLQEFEAAITDVPQDGLNWQPGPDMNSMAVLIVHTAGSARYWVGDISLGDSSNRDRDSEFASRQHDSAALRARLAEIETYVEHALDRLTMADLTQERPINQFGRESTTVGWALLHALQHTAQHVGHVQITRQLWEQHNTVQ